MFSSPKMLVLERGQTEYQTTDRTSRVTALLLLCFIRLALTHQESSVHTSKVFIVKYKDLFPSCLTQWEQRCGSWGGCYSVLDWTLETWPTSLQPYLGITSFTPSVEYTCLIYVSINKIRIWSAACVLNFHYPDHLLRHPCFCIQKFPLFPFNMSLVTAK